MNRAWWLDPIVGLLIAEHAVAEGRDAWRSDGCCTAAPLSLRRDGRPA
jgi:hypothetical protein